jgi:hypothetical protein
VGHLGERGGLLDRDHAGQQPDEYGDNGHDNATYEGFHGNSLKLGADGFKEGIAQESY